MSCSKLDFFLYFEDWGDWHLNPSSEKRNDRTVSFNKHIEKQPMPRDLTVQPPQKYMTLIKYRDIRPLTWCSLMSCWMMAISWGMVCRSTSASVISALFNHASRSSSSTLLCRRSVSPLESLALRCRPRAVNCHKTTTCMVKKKKCLHVAGHSP